jgi:hypothetical protein
LVALVLTAPAAAAPPCGDQVLRDWSDNGRIDRLYPLSCYEDAVAVLPQDLRDYTDAEGVIARALQSAVRSEPARARLAADTSGSSSPPTLLLVLAGASVAVLAAGILGFLVRHASAGRTGPRG